jgi:GPI-anchor transamidase subunit U
VTALLYSYSLLLLPLFHHLWLHAGSGNANFFYAITLVWALAGSSSILDAMWAWGRLAWERERDIAPLTAEDIGKKRVVAQL